MLPGLGSWLNSRRQRYSGFLDSKYDSEIWSVAIPALAAMLLDPVMGVMNSGALLAEALWLACALDARLCCCCCCCC